MGDLVLGQHLVDFFLGLTLCQQLIVEESPEGPGHPAVYQVRARYVPGPCKATGLIRLAQAPSAST